MRPESTLNQLRQSLPSGRLPSSYGVYFKNTLVALCHALEDHILQTAAVAPDHRPLVLVTFQQGKWYLQEAERYQEIAACAGEVAIAAVPDSGFATHPTGQLDNVSLINLDPSDSLTQEWNLIILAPGYAAMLLCHELSDEDYQASNQPQTDVERKFYGLWTFERELVETAADIFITQVQGYDSDLATRLTNAKQAITQDSQAPAIDLSGVVSRIISYLQSSQEQLITVNRQTREFWELEGQAMRLNRNLNANKLQAFLRMAQRVDGRDPFNPIASLQVAALAETLGQLLDLPTIQQRRLRLAGLMFRIGLAEAPPDVFCELASHLQASKQTVWHNRASLGAQLLQAMPELEPVATIIRHQREHWDGSGRPDGIQGEQIPIESQILGLVARFQELTQARAERPALSLADALARCQRHSGTRYQPRLLETLGNVVQLTTMGMMELPSQPKQMPTIWLEDIQSSKPEHSKEVSP